MVPTAAGGEAPGLGRRAATATAALLALAILAGCGVKGDPISPSEAAAEAAEEVDPVAEERLPGT